MEPPSEAQCGASVATVLADVSRRLRETVYPIVVESELNTSPRCGTLDSAPPQLSNCYSLSNPGTGSETLVRREYELRNESDLEFQRGAGGYERWVAMRHKHFFRAHRKNASWAPGTLDNSRCYLLTLRDPVARLSSLWRNWLPPTEHAAGYGLARTANMSLSQFVQHVRSGDDIIFTAFNLSVFEPVYSRTRNLPIKPAVNGLVSQVDWLRGFEECSVHNLHVICTETFDDDWAKFRVEAGRASAGFNTSSHIRSRSNRAAKRSAIKSMGLTDADKAFIRGCMYPFDFALHQRFCQEH
jgi:hypothetical protein